MAASTFKILLLPAALVALGIVNVTADGHTVASEIKPCVSRDYGHTSFVCVCNR